MKVRELLSDESKWTKGCAARKASLQEVDPLSDEAVSFCISGAMQRCYPVFQGAMLWELITRRVGLNVPRWNDAPERTFSEVKALVDELDI